MAHEKTTVRHKPQCILACGEGINQRDSYKQSSALQLDEPAPLGTYLVMRWSALMAQGEAAVQQKPSLLWPLMGIEPWNHQSVIYLAPIVASSVVVGETGVEPGQYFVEGTL